MFKFGKVNESLQGMEPTLTEIRFFNEDFGPSKLDPDSLIIKDGLMLKA